MFVVPIAKDKIKTKDGVFYRVIEYTNYKDGGPAVYARSPGSSELTVVYFFDIIEINKVAVEFQKSSKVFNAFGKIARHQQLPQENDKVQIYSSRKDFEGTKRTVEVKSLKLKSKSLGISHGMLFRDKDGDYHRIKNILDIDPDLGADTFNRDEFITLYKDYLGV
jgi:hypothetical protein